jgi:indole-3-glycerol phosphate synthase
VSVLDRILERGRERLAERRAAVPESRVRAEAEAAPVPPDFRDAVERPGTSVIAEAKRRSPSRPHGFGVGRALDPAQLAREYEAAGARALSVLTEPDFFGGHADDLRSARAACRLPVLRKDFLVDPYQCWETRAWGASAALLIVAALDDARLRDLHDLLGELGLAALVEVHTEAEADRALAVSPRLVGVNNRDLGTFVADRSTTARVAARLPAGTTLVAESGISTREHVLEMEAAGAAAVLVGEALLVSTRPGDRVRELRGADGTGAG